MTKNNWMLAVVAVVLAAVYVIYFTDWFRPKTVEIYSAYRDLGSRAARQQGALPAMRFSSNRQLKLTEIKVVSCADLETNKNAFALWHLISESNSVPIKWFFYGERIGGMHPAVEGTHPQSLETNVTYRIFVTAGKITGHHDFALK
ncbi:MAG TPA: hypothetical protein VK742_11835 [Candidatus Sulfotelmatobacter sp.]|jgi:hypothetical protein|nr:hypothetical protein [Candidatus Sulfotelmatobacter sp.]